MNTVKACVICRIGQKGYGPCPRCGGEMENLGHCYRVPVQTNRRDWKRVELFIAAKRARGMGAWQSPTYHASDSFNPPELLPKAQRPNPKRKSPEDLYRASTYERDRRKRAKRRVGA